MGGNAARRRQQLYVETFDLDRRTRLHLTYCVHSDTRKRGITLLRLNQRYTAAGLPLDTDELPDFLPALLGFAALAPDGYEETLLGEHRLSLELLRLASYLDLRWDEHSWGGNICFLTVDTGPCSLRAAGASDRISLAPRPRVTKPTVQRMKTSSRFCRPIRQKR